MNRLRILLITTALITGGSALASAQEYRHHDADNSQYRNSDRHYGRDRAWHGDGDHDRDDQYVYQNGRYGNYRQQVYRDRNWRDRDNDDRRVYEHRERGNRW